MSKEITAYVYKAAEADQQVNIIKESKQTESAAFGVGGEQAPPYDLSGLANFYAENGYHTRCINLKATLTAGIGFDIVPANDPDQQQDDEYKKVIDFIDAHPSYSGQTFMDTLISFCIDSETFGNAAFELARNLKQELAEIYHIPFRDCLISYHPEEKKKIFNRFLLQRTGIGDVTFIPFGYTGEAKDRNEFLHLKTYNPKNRFYGIPEYIGALRAMGLDISALSYNIARMKNNNRPDCIIEIKADDNPAIRSQAEAFFAANFKCEDNAGRGLLLFTGESAENKDRVKVTLLDGQTKEGSYRLQRLDNRDEIIAAHGIPRTILGISQAGKLGNSEDGEFKIFKQTIIEPRQTRLEFMLNEFILKQGLGVTKWKIEFKELTIEDFNQNATALVNLFMAGLVEKDEARADLGYAVSKDDSEEDPAAIASEVAAVATALNLNGVQIQAATKIVASVSAGEVPRDSGKNQLKIFFNLTDEQAEQLLGAAGTGKVIEPDKKKTAQAEALVKSLIELKKALQEQMK